MFLGVSALNLRMSYLIFLISQILSVPFRVNLSNTVKLCEYMLVVQNAYPLIPLSKTDLSVLVHAHLRLAAAVPISETLQLPCPRSPV